MRLNKNRKGPEDRTKYKPNDRSYRQDPSSHESRWTNRVFRDEKTGALIIPTPEYMLGADVNGTFNSSNNIIENKRERPNPSYEKTSRHELYHAKGHGEYVTRFLNNDPWMNYQ